MHNNIQNINVLIEIISNEIQQGKSNLNTSVNIQKTVTYWNVGKHISDHLMYHKDNSNYGQYLIPRLSEALNIGKRTLYLSIQFYKLYKNIDSVVKYLTWSHFKVLITIKSEIKRKEYEQILLEKKLTVRDLSVLIKKDNNKIVTDQTNQLTIFPGKLYIYKIKNKNNKKYLDLGFNIYSDQFIDKYSDFPVNSVIEAVKNKSGYKFKTVSCDSSYVFTYKAKVTKVIDGDTIKTNIDLGFNNITNKTLRFRGINAFDVGTKDGNKAKEFVLSRISNNMIIIKTYKPDKYSRYLVDVYCSDVIDECFEDDKPGDCFLNQMLLDNGLAVKYYIY